MKKILFLLAFLASLPCIAQDLAFGRHIVDTLTSSTFWGRGYTRDGMKKAADFLASEFAAYKISPMKGKSFLQPYSYSVNTFPGKVSVRINDQELIPGKDFILGGGSRAVKASGRLQQSDSVNFVDPAERVMVSVEKKLTMDVSQKVYDYTHVQVLKNVLSSDPRFYKVDIENEFVKKFNASNICGMVPGTAVPDSFIVITAHYDHLGGFGPDTYFPGANDNASGVALLMNLAHYYASHPQRYSIGFILFSGEEAGLEGSKFFTEHPLIPLKNIRFLLNTDLAGTGEDGITVVNATEFPKEFELLQQVNTSGQWLKAVNPRGKASISDHYFFTEKGVPCFFFYTLGGVAYYHDVFDRSETLPLNEHEDLFKLLVAFNEKLMGP